VSSVYTTIGQLATIDFLVSLIVIALLAIVGVAVVRRSLRPLTDIEQTAGAIAAGDLSRRVPERDPRTEVGRLGRSLNAMLSQIESAFHARARSEESARRSEEKMRQFVADASHELRTPLTAIRGFAEYYRQRGGIDMGSNGTGKLAPADLDRIMRRVEQEASRMGILVEDMLLLARLDQQRPLEARPVDLLSLAADAVHDARVVAPNRSIHLTVGSGAALLVIGDEVRLRQVIGNLMSNALSHTPDGTPIDVLIRSGNLNEAPVATTPPPPPPPEPARGLGEADQFSVGAIVTDDTAAADDTVTANDAVAANDNVPDQAPAEPVSEWQARGYRAGSQPAAVLEVIDHGPGLTREQANHVFERFYRSDPARSRTSGGSGLGLSIVSAIVAAHGGSVVAVSSPGHGMAVTVRIPLSTPELDGDRASGEKLASWNAGDPTCVSWAPGGIEVATGASCCAGRASRSSPFALLNLPACPIRIDADTQRTYRIRPARERQGEEGPAAGRPARIAPSGIRGPPPAHPYCRAAWSRRDCLVS